MADPESTKETRVLWKPQDVEKTNMWAFMREVETRRGIKLPVSLLSSFLVPYFPFDLLGQADDAWPRLGGMSESK